MKATRSQLHFLWAVLGWVIVLQSVMFGHLQKTGVLCNGAGSWSLAQLSFLSFWGSALITVFFTATVLVWGWKILGRLSGTQQAFTFILQVSSWALLGGTGISHSLERLSSNCVLDYWQLELWQHSLYFNLGDIALTFGTALLIGLWLGEGRRS